MSGLNGALYIGKSALAAQLYGMQVTGNNISNVNTEGYSRQRVNLTPSTSVTLGNRLILGTGVDIAQVQRIRDGLIDIQIRSQKGSQSRWASISDTLEGIETLFNETADGTVGDLINEFWNSWQDLSNDPESSVNKTLVMERGLSLASRLNYIEQSLSTTRSDINTALSTMAEQVNSITESILDLNTKIQQYEGGNQQQANNYRDARDLLLDQLSELANITTAEMSDGTVSVYISGSLLVSASSRRELTTAPNSEGMNDICWSDNGNQVLLTDGKILGALESRDTIIPKYISRLDEIAKAIIENVNRIHSRGLASNLYSTCSSTNSVNDPSAALTAAGLPFDVTNGTFTISVYDADGNFVEEQTITVDPSTDTLNDIRDAINAAFMSTGNITAAIDSTNKLTITASGSNRFGFVNSSGTGDSSDLLMALGLNTFFTGYDAGTIGINPEIEFDPTKIACGKTRAPGDNTIATMISDLKDELLLDGNTLTISSYYESTIGTMGIDSQEAQRYKDNADLLESTFENQREAYSGVSLDEEMTEMLKFQYAYNAAAKYIATINDIMQVLFNTM